MGGWQLPNNGWPAQEPPSLRHDYRILNAYETHLAAPTQRQESQTPCDGGGGDGLWRERASSCCWRRRMGAPRLGPAGPSDWERETHIRSSQGTEQRDKRWAPTGREGRGVCGGAGTGYRGGRLCGRLRVRPPRLDCYEATLLLFALSRTCVACTCARSRQAADVLDVVLGVVLDSTTLA